MISVPEFDDLAAAFGAPASAFLSRQEGSEFERRYRKEAAAAKSLFFKGGRLSEHGLKLKDGIDSIKAHKAIRALLCSFEPSHEAKIGTVAKYLHEWCDECEPIAEQAEPEKQPKPKTKPASKKWRKKR
jgi:hypothetical protein